jgi:hypothetical protein
VRNDSLCFAALFVFGALAVDLLVSYVISGGRCEGINSDPSDSDVGASGHDQNDLRHQAISRKVEKPKSLSEQIDPNSKTKNRSHPRLEVGYWMSQIALAVLGVGGIVIALCTLQSLKTANELTGQQLEASVRPVVGFNVIGNPTQTGTKNGQAQYGIPVTIFNFAKFYASNLGAHISIETDFKKGIKAMVQDACQSARDDGQFDANVLGPESPSLITWNFPDLGNFPKQSFILIGCVAYGDQVKTCQTDELCYFQSFCRVWAPAANGYLSGLPNCNAAQ